MTDLNQLVNDPSTSFAVVGASDNPEKYGGRIYRNLKGKGYKVFAVNPGAETVDGDPAYPGLADIPEVPTVVVLVVPGKVGVGVLEDAAGIGVDKIWVQPGAFSDGLGKALDKGGFDYVAEACVMRHTAAASAT
jgi:uncharacterized protein